MLQIETIHWHTLAPQFINEQSKVLDLGANFGQFAHEIVKRTGCQCVAIEPAPQAFDIIETNANISKQQCAVGGKAGIRKFLFDRENPVGSGFSECEGAIDVEVKTLPGLMSELGWERLDLLKADIEGAEIELLDSCSDDFLKNQIGQITVEFHDFCKITPKETVLKTIARLNRLGFYSLRMSQIGHQDTWHANSNLLPASAAEVRYHQIVTRNLVSAKRAAKRTLNRVFRMELPVA